MSKLTQEQKDALEELHATYKGADRTPENAYSDVYNVWNMISESDDNADNELFSNLNSDLKNLSQEVIVFENKSMSADKVEYFYNRLDEIANSYKF